MERSVSALTFATGKYRNGLLCEGAIRRSGDSACVDHGLAPSETFGRREDPKEFAGLAAGAGGLLGQEGGFGGEGGFPGFGNPANVPQFPGGGSNVIPAAFGRRNKKKK